MKGSLLRIASFHLVNGREIAMRIYHIGLKTERGLERESRPLIVAGTNQRDAKIEMCHREAMEQTYGAQGMIDGLLVVAESPVNRRETEVSASVIFIQSYRLFIGHLCVLPLQQSHISVADLDINSRKLRVHRLGLEQSSQRAAKIAAREFDPSPE